MKDQIQGIDLPKGKPCSKACSKSITGRPGRAVSGNLDGKSPGSACVSLPIELGELNRFVNFVLVLSSSAPVVAAKKNQEKSETHSFLFSSLPLPLKNTKQRNKTKQQVRARPRGRRQVVRVYLFFNFVFLRLEKKHENPKSKDLDQDGKTLTSVLSSLSFPFFTLFFFLSAAPTSATPSSRRETSLGELFFPFCFV